MNRFMVLFVFSAEAPCRRVPDHVSVSKITYFKRKFLDEDEESHFSFRTYCQTVSKQCPEEPRVRSVCIDPVTNLLV